MRLLPVLLLAAASLISAPAQAGELFVGLHKHAVDTPLNLAGGLEQGADLSAGYRFSGINGSRIQPYVFGALNSAGDTSYAAAGISAKFGRRIYVRPGIGLAIHNGSAAKFNRADRIAFGSRILFEPELAVGAQVNPQMSVEASIVHMSHGTLFSGQNPGIDNIGVRLNFGL
jgi:hypothetical protein